MKRRRDATSAREGYVIFAVLIVIVVLSLVAYRYTDAMSGEYQAAVRANDAAQARLAAISGLYYAAAVLSDRLTFYNELGGHPTDNPDIFEIFEIPVPGPNGTTRTAYFSIQCAGLNEDGASVQRYGVIDEGGKININSMIALDPKGDRLHEALMKLPNMTSAIADAIVDWVDADDDPRPEGAESSYYLSLPNPYKAKNGPLNSLDELLLVQGVTPELLYGGDRNRNGILDEGETDSSRGWSDYLTVYGREINVDINGNPRIYLNGDNLQTLYADLEAAVGAELATYVVAHKLFGSQPVSSNSSGKQTLVAVSPEELYQVVQERIATTGTSGRRIRSVAELIGTQIRLPRPPGYPKDAPDRGYYSPLNTPEGLAQLFPLLLDATTVRQAIEMTPRININTAPMEVLMAIPGISDVEVAGILSGRLSQDPTSPATTTGAWLLTSGLMDPSRFRRLERYITGSSMVYRVQAIGFLEKGGPVARFEAVIDTNQGAPRFLQIRDLSDLDQPRGFQPPIMLNSR